VSVWAVVPVKSFETAKSRLAGFLNAGDRAALAREMLAHVLSVLSATQALVGVVVVTDSPRVADAARAGGAVPVFDPRPGPNGARSSATLLRDCVDFGLEEIRARGATAGLVLMSDLPLLTVGSVHALLRELERFDVVIARDASGQHTNALALRLGTPFPTSFGSPDSFERHAETASRANLSLSVLAVPTPEHDALAFDVDTPEDYEKLRRFRQ
jgi:2-phospho-L-lactate guanylyltransferase